MVLKSKDGAAQIRKHESVFFYLLVDDIIYSDILISRLAGKGSASKGGEGSGKREDQQAA